MSGHHGGQLVPATRRDARRALVLLLLLAATLGGWILWREHGPGGIQAWLSQHHAALLAWQATQPLAFLLGFVALFVVVSALTLPGGAPLCLLAGSAFGTVGGAAVLGLASALGALLPFLVARHIARERVQRAFGHRLRYVEALMSRRGALHLFLLRVVPIVPFPVLNPLLGLSSVSLARFFWPSLVGLTLGSLPYTWAGQSLGALLAGEPGWMALAGACASLLLLWLVSRGARVGAAAGEAA